MFLAGNESQLTWKIRNYRIISDIGIPGIEKPGKQMSHESEKGRPIKNNHLYKPGIERVVG